MLRSSHHSSTLVMQPRRTTRNSSRVAKVPCPRCQALPDKAPPATEKKSDEYSDTMQQRMGGSLTYRHELGMNYHYILPDLIVGSCPQSPADIDFLAEQEQVDVIYSLQENSDMEYFGIDIDVLQSHAKKRGDIQHVRHPIHDFDPYDLRCKLPSAVTLLAKATGAFSTDTTLASTGSTSDSLASVSSISSSFSLPTSSTTAKDARANPSPTSSSSINLSPRRRKVYIHCTAGLGRAPGTALAYMSWVLGMPLHEAHALLTTQRACNPKVEAIRSATVDLLLGSPRVDVTIGLHRSGDAQRVQIAGLDVGWNKMLDLVRDVKSGGRWVLRRPMAIGQYQYKFILDGMWSCSADHPSIPDGPHTNNLLSVVAALQPKEADAVSRLMDSRGLLTEMEQRAVWNLLASGNLLNNTGNGGTIDL